MVLGHTPTANWMADSLGNNLFDKNNFDTSNNNYNDAKDSNGNTALHRAIISADKEKVDDLLNDGANIDIVQSDGYSPLYLSVQQGKSIQAILFNYIKI